MKTRLLGMLFIILLALTPNCFGTPVPQDSSSVKVSKPEKTTMIYIVNGEEKTATEVDKLDLEAIEQMEYIKDKEKIKKYTDKDVDTVVVITLKDEKNPEDEEEPEDE